MDYKFISAKYCFEGWKQEPKLIVMHWVAGSAKSAIETFKNGLKKASAHFVIDKKGCTTQMVSLDNRAWHSGVSSCIFGNYANNYSFGIELEGPPSLIGCKGWSIEQLNEAIEVCKYISKIYPSVTHITDHSFISPGRKIDVRGSTGKEIDVFPWDELVKMTGLINLT
jgi:N-acetyl-anhydromuramyl-L-alanine amidase AmpD